MRATPSSDAVSEEKRLSDACVKASYVLLKISGDEADEGCAPYTNGKPYRVQFR